MPDERPPALLTIVGSGTLAPHPTRGSPAHHLRTPGASVLLDCGPGTVHGLARCGIDWEALTHVVVTHFHNDHFGDLPALLVALKHAASRPRTEPLVLTGPPGFRELLDALVVAHGDYVGRQGFAVVPVELGPEGFFGDRRGRLAMRTAPTPHTDESICVRLQGTWGSVGYTGDTGPSAEVAELLAGVGVLVAECTWTDPSDDQGHLTPSRVAELARDTAPDLLVVTHVMPPTRPEEVVARVREEYDGRVVAGADGLRIRISDDAATVDPPEGAA